MSVQNFRVCGRSNLEASSKTGLSIVALTALLIKRQVKTFSVAFCLRCDRFESFRVLKNTKAQKTHILGPWTQVFDRSALPLISSSFLAMHSSNAYAMINAPRLQSNNSELLIVLNSLQVQTLDRSANNTSTVHVGTSFGKLPNL